MERSTDTITRATIDEFEADPSKFISGVRALAHAPGCPEIPVKANRPSWSSDWPSPCCIDVPATSHTIKLEGPWEPNEGEGTGRRSDAPSGPSEKQIRFLTALLRGAGVPEDEILSKVPDSRSRCSTRIDGLLSDDVKPVWEPIVPGVVGCSPAQESFIRSLADERGVEVADEWLATKAAASAAIDELKRVPRQQAKRDTTPQVDFVKGEVHQLDGEYVRVHESQGGGRFYAARFDGSKFHYERGLIVKLNAETKLSAEAAAEFGRLYHICCFCSRALDTPESTEAGYGPVCADRHGLPWG